MTQESTSKFVTMDIKMLLLKEEKIDITPNYLCCVEEGEFTALILVMRTLIMLQINRTLIYNDKSTVQVILLFNVYISASGVITDGDIGESPVQK